MTLGRLYGVLLLAPLFAACGSEAGGAISSTPSPEASSVSNTPESRDSGAAVENPKPEGSDAGGGGEDAGGNGGPEGGVADIDGGLDDGGAPDSGDAGGSSSTGAAWSAITSYVGTRATLPGSCSTYVQKLTNTSTCAHAYVDTMSGTGACTATVKFTSAPGTGAITAIVHEFATTPAPGNFCYADVVAVVPPTTAEVTIPLVLQPDGSAKGTGSRPDAQDTTYTLIVKPGVSIHLTAAGHIPSLAARQAAASSGTCVGPMHDSSCTFAVP